MTDFINVNSLVINLDDETFDCGVPLVNNYLYEDDLTARKICIVNEKIILACMSYSIGTVSIHDKDSDISTSNEIPVLKINALGVSVDYKEQGFGTSLIQFAIRTANSIYPFVEIKGIFLQALEDAVPFYETLDFKNLEPTRYNLPMPDTTNMGYQMFFHIDKAIKHLDLFPPFDHSYDYI